MPWYQFSNDRGFGVHQYDLPGRPASHGCVRMLERDAKWVYEWVRVDTQPERTLWNTGRRSLSSVVMTSSGNLAQNRLVGHRRFTQGMVEPEVTPPRRYICRFRHIDSVRWVIL
jgi:hypothetical protein